MVQRACQVTGQQGEGDERSLLLVGYSASVSDRGLLKGWVDYQTLNPQQVDPGRAREERIQASLKEREREVKMSRSAHEKEWGRERDQLRKTEAVQQFKAILVDVVRLMRGTECIVHDTLNSAWRIYSIQSICFGVSFLILLHSLTSRCVMSV